MKASWLPLVLMIGACGGERGTGDVQEEEGVFDDLTGTVDEAQQVEKAVLEHKDRVDRALQDAEQSGNSGDP